MSRPDPHILMLVRSLSLDGPGRLLSGLLACSDPAQAQVSVVSLGAHGPLGPLYSEQALRLGGRFEVLPSGWLGIARAARVVEEWAEQWEVTHLHAHLLMPDMVARRVADRTGIPLVVTEHGTHGWSERGALLAPLIAQWYRRTQHPCAAIVAVSPRVRRELLAAGISPRRIRVIPNGLNSEDHEPASQERRWSRRGELSIPARAHPVIVVLGNLGRNKAPQVALRAFAHLMQTNPAGAPEPFLVFAGEGPLRRSLAAEAARLGVANQTIFTGHRPDPRPVLEAADMLLHPSRSESFGLAMMEALATGLPVVARAGAGPEAVLPPSPLGHLVEGDDPAAWCHAIRNAARIALEGTTLFQDACRHFVQQSYPIARTRDAYMQLYRETLEQAVAESPK